MTDVRCFVVRANGEWGTFFLREGVHQTASGPQHWAELTCNTAFGCVGYHWGNMGGDATWFLSKVGKSYLLGKLWGARREVFDGEEAILDARRIILRQRRARDISAAMARERWEALEDAACNSEVEWHELVTDNDWLWVRLLEGSGPLGQVPNPQAEGFYRDLWPSFIAQLQQVPVAVAEAQENG